jgi:hypothetical protein
MNLDRDGSPYSKVPPQGFCGGFGHPHFIILEWLNCPMAMNHLFFFFLPLLLFLFYIYIFLNIFNGAYDICLFLKGVDVDFHQFLDGGTISIFSHKQGI